MPSSFEARCRELAMDVRSIASAHPMKKRNLRAAARLIEALPGMVEGTLVFEMTGKYREGWEDALSVLRSRLTESMEDK